MNKVAFCIAMLDMPLGIRKGLHGTVKTSWTEWLKRNGLTEISPFRDDRTRDHHFKMATKKISGFIIQNRLWISEENYLYVLNSPLMLSKILNILFRFKLIPFSSCNCCAVGGRRDAPNHQRSDVKTDR
jgi:hypothetical protein